MVGFVLADVEPFAHVIGGSPGPGGVDGGEPGVVALFELGEGFFADLLEVVEVEGELVALDGGAAGVAEVHGGVPFFGDVGGPTAPLDAFEGVHLVVGFGGGEVEEKSADGVGILVEEPVELLEGEGWVGDGLVTARRIQVSCETKMPSCGV